MVKNERSTFGFKYFLEDPKFLLKSKINFHIMWATFSGLSNDRTKEFFMFKTNEIIASFLFFFYMGGVSHTVTLNRLFYFCDIYKVFE